MKYRILASFILLIFLLPVVVMAAGIDLYSSWGDYKIELPASKHVISVYADKNMQSAKVAFLPKGSFIINALPDQEVRTGGLVQVKYAYIAAVPECSEINEDLSTKSNIFLAMEGVFEDKYAIDSNAAKVKEALGSKYKGYCYRQGAGWVEEKYLVKTAPPEKPKIKTQVSGECTECKADTKKSSLDTYLSDKEKILKEVQKIDKTSEVIQTLPPQDPSCGQPGRPVKTDLGAVVVGKEWTPVVRAFLEERVNKSGTKYKVRRERVEWECQTVFPQGCGKKDKFPIEKTAAIADATYKKPLECKNTLEAFYDSCSPWKSESTYERFKKVMQSSNNVVVGLRQNMKEEGFSIQVTADLLTCIAKRESTDLDPIRLNYTACQERSSSKNVSETFMQGWKSTASGLSQHLRSTVNSFWKYWLDKASPLSNSQKTYQQVYGSSENLFKAMSADPQLQLEIMARHLDKLIKLYKKQGDPDPFTRAILSYDTDQKETYIPAIKSCMACLKKEPGDFGCVQNLHFKTKRGKK